MNFKQIFKTLKHGGKIRRKFWSTSKCKYITKSGRYTIMDDKGNDIKEISVHDLLSNDWVDATEYINVQKYKSNSFYYYEKNEYYRGILFIHSYDRSTDTYLICEIEQVDACEIDYKRLVKTGYTKLTSIEVDKEYPKKYEVDKKYWTKINRLYNRDPEDETTHDNFFEEVKKSINDIFNMKTVNNID